MRRMVSAAIQFLGGGGKGTNAIDTAAAAAAAG